MGSDAPPTQVLRESGVDGLGHGRGYRDEDRHGSDNGAEFHAKQFAPKAGPPRRGRRVAFGEDSLPGIVFAISARPATDKPNARSAWRKLLDGYGMLLVALALFALCSVLVPNFFTMRNMVGLTESVSMVGMVACTMMFCLAAGDVDLSVGTLVPCSGVILAVVLKNTHNIGLAVLAALGFGIAVGLLNGIAVAKIKIGALIATLATMQIVKSLSLVIADGKAVGIAHDGFNSIGSAYWPPVKIGEFHGLPVPVWITAATMALFAVVMQKTVFGRNTLAIGGNPEAANLAGINVARTRIIIFVLQGLVTALAGLVLASRMTSGQPNSSVGFELDVIAACVLGGVSLSGGV